MRRASDPHEEGFVRLHDGTAVCVPLSLELLTPYVLLEQGDWFEDEIRFVRKLAQPGMKAVDVGANYGLYTLALAGGVGAAGRVWSVEPTSGLIPYLRRSLRRNTFGTVEIVQAALADREGSAWLSTGANSETNMLSPDRASEGEQVRVETLDRLHARFGWQDVAFLKIDAEGAESAIFEGGRGFLQSASPLVMIEVRQGHRTNTAVLGRFNTLGYRTYRLIPGLSALAPWAAGDGLEDYWLNMFLCKPDRALRLSAAGLLVQGEPTKPAIPVDDRHWLAHLGGMPFARARIDAWRRWASRPASFGSEHYRAAVSAYAMAHARDVPVADRYGHLRCCFDTLGALIKSQATVPRICTFIRAAVELGSRQRAVGALKALLERIVRKEIRWADEPFVPMAAEWDQAEPGGNVKAWITACAFEETDRLSHFSAYFDAEQSLTRLDWIMKLPGHSPRAERRWRLVRWRLGFASDDDSFAGIERAG